MPNAEPESRAVIVMAAQAEEVLTGLREALQPLPVDLKEAGGGLEALNLARDQQADLLLADMPLGDVSGVGLCRLVREDSELAGLSVVLVCPYRHEIDRILGFEAGADDVVQRPFYTRELTSRVGAILRRARARHEHSNTLGAVQEGPLLFDPATGRVEVAGRPVNFTPKEYEIFAAVARNSGRILSRNRIVYEVWDHPIGDPRVVDAHIKAIRRKLGEAGRAIQTVRGVGFRFSMTDVADASDPEPLEAQDEGPNA